MKEFNKYCCLVFLLFFYFLAKGQYLCNNEYKVINKQRKIIRKKSEAIAKQWFLNNVDSLNLPKDIKFSKIKFLAEEDKQWYEIDSLLCIKKDNELADKAIKKLTELQLPVYDIRSYFNFENTSNPEIKSILYFQFDINGELIKTVIREKETSPNSEIYYH